VVTNGSHGQKRDPTSKNCPIERLSWTKKASNQEKLSNSRALMEKYKVNHQKKSDKNVLIGLFSVPYLDTTFLNDPTSVQPDFFLKNSHDKQ